MKPLVFDPKAIGPIPGPKSLEFLKVRERLLPKGLYNFHPLFVRRAHGALLEDVDGNVLIDFAGGLGCLNVGHTPEEVVRAVQQQAEDFLFSCFHVAMHQPYLQLVEKLVSYMPGPGGYKGMLINSGAEAVENAIKIARSYTGRPAVVTFQNAFHGRTLLTLALTSKTRTYKKGFGPFAAEVYRLPYAYCYRCPINLSFPACEISCAGLLEEFFETQVAATEIAALIVEPVQGEGGFIVPPEGYLSKLQDICRRHGILLVVDEVQTGIARTGSMFAFQHHGIEPDILVLSKSLGGGLPISAVVGRSEIMDAPQVGGLGGTFGGSPLACAAALQVLAIAEQENLSARAQAIGRRIVERTALWQERFTSIGDVRSDGAMVGIEFVKDRTSREPAGALVERLKSECLKRGLLVISAGTHSNVLRFLMPLVIDDATLAQGLDILEEVLRGQATQSPNSFGSMT